MLGGPVYIAFIRFAISLAGVIYLFLLMSESRFDRKKTMIGYGAFSLFLITGACIWYMADRESCVRLVAFVMYFCFCVFSVCISSDHFYLSVYKLALTFYLLAAFLIGGLEVSILFLTGMCGWILSRAFS